MNIKSAPCLARIVAPGREMNGWIVSVMYWHPGGGGQLPDGFHIHPATPGAWICESLMHSPFVAPVGTKLQSTRKARYAAIKDAFLRPLPGIEDPEQIDERMPESEAA